LRHRLRGTVGAAVVAFGGGLQFRKEVQILAWFAVCSGDHPGLLLIVR
jgi:hypothetical protein